MHTMLQLPREDTKQHGKKIRVNPPVWPGNGIALFNELDYCVEPKATCEFKDALITRGGFCFLGLRLASASFYTYPSRQKKWLTHAWASRLRRRTERLSDEETFALIHNAWTGGYFFWITEALPRLWSIRSKWPELALLLPSHTRLSGVMDDSVRPLPLKRVHWLPRAKNVIAPQIVMPGNSKRKARYDPALMTSIRDFYLEIFGSRRKPFKKIYISRANAAHRRLQNEDALLAQLHQRGFEPVEFELLSFSEQVRLMSETKVLVGPHGAGFSNITFMPAGGIVLEFQLSESERREIDMEDEQKLNKSFCRLASVMGHDYAVIPSDGTGNGGTKVRNLKLDLSQLSAALDTLRT